MTNAQNTTTLGRLTPEQIKHYGHEGYTLFKQQVFAPNQFARLKAIFEEDLERYGENDLDMIHARDARLLEFLLSDEILDIVEPLVGPDIGLWASQFLSKPPFKGAATPWHEDSAYWEGRISTMKDICTVWLALDTVDRENGSMGVIPGTHTGVGGFSAYEQTAERALGTFGRQIKPELVDQSRAVYFSLGANECSLHEARIMHGAEANTSPRRRAGYTMRYFPATSQVFAKRNPGHKLWLARGRDHAGNHYQNA